MPAAVEGRRAHGNGTAVGANFDGELHDTIGLLQFNQAVGEVDAVVELAVGGVAEVVAIAVHAAAELQRAERATVNLDCRGAGQGLGRMKGQE